MSLLAKAILIGKITGSKIDKPKNAVSGQARILTVAIAGAQKELVQLVCEAGEDVNPQDGAVVIILESANGIKFGVATFDGIAPVVAKGERRLYSYDANGTVLARHKLKASGKQFIGNGSGNLGSGLDSLAGALDTLSNATSTAAVTAGAATSVTLAAALVALLTAFNVSLATAKSAIDGVLDTAE
jgi:hypothetical protein